MKNGINVLVSGAKGFLLRNTLKEYDWNVIEYQTGGALNWE